MELGPSRRFLLGWNWLLHVTLVLLQAPRAKGQGRTYGELDVLFDMNVPARNFATTQVNSDEKLAEVVGTKMVEDEFIERKS